ncbi:MAG: hypothetical protein OEZ47_16495, partial [Gammaproteobacteria bacterium]|nr:hypothetical protein [Gammaproteobacteria bacterium]
MGKEFRVIFRLHAWEKERTNWGSECAKKIRLEIERLSKGKLKLKPVGISVEGGYIEDLHEISQHLDYWVFYADKHIATVEPTCSNYTFLGSKIMPVRFYKGELIKQSEVPVFVVFNMTKEYRALKDQCVWIHGKDVIKSEDWTEELGGKLQHNYFTDKNDWHRGLQTLVDEL